MENFYVFEAEEPEDTLPFYLRGEAFQWGKRILRRYETNGCFQHFVQGWEKVTYAGKLRFRQVDGKDGVRYQVGDIVVAISEAEYQEGVTYSTVPMLEALFPLPELEGSFLSAKMYETADYSRYADAVHGAIADAILAQWNGPVRAVADGAGLFKSRGGDRVQSSDIAIYPWVHRGVRKQTITEALRESQPDELQVMCYCNAFLTDEDYALIRHPYIFIDKYQPKKQGLYQNDHVTSSIWLDVGAGELHAPKNPPFSENLLRLGKVSFYSDHVVSQYARRLGMVGDGPKVTQVWQEMVDHPTDYCALVGMVPIFEQYDPSKPIFTRIVYHSETSNLPVGASIFDAGDCYFFYFSDPRRFEYPELGEARPFPVVSGQQYVGKTYGQLEADYGQKIADWLVDTFEREHVFLGRQFYDFSQCVDLWEYRFNVDRGMDVPPILANQYVSKKLLRKKGKYYFFCENANVRTAKIISVGVCPWRLIEIYMEYVTKPSADEMSVKYGPGKWQGDGWELKVSLGRNDIFRDYTLNEHLNPGTYVFNGIPPVTFTVKKRIRLREWVDGRKD